MARISDTNETARFNCTATGFPGLIVRWVKAKDVDDRDVGGNSIGSSNDLSTSVLTVTGPGEGGMYSCIGTPSTGKEFVHNVTVYGLFLSIYPVIIVLAIHLCLVALRVHLSTTPRPAIFGQMMTVNCTVVQGYPKPSVILSPVCGRCKLMATNSSKYYTTKVTPSRVGVKLKCLVSNKVDTVRKLHYADSKTKYCLYCDFITGAFVFC